MVQSIFYPLPLQIDQSILFVSFFLIGSVGWTIRIFYISSRETCVGKFVWGSQTLLSKIINV